MSKFYEEKTEKIINNKKNPKVWILVGNEENWETALQDNIWGIKKNSKNRWDKLEKKRHFSFLYFTASKWSSGIWGVETKFKQNKPL